MIPKTNSNKTNRRETFQFVFVILGLIKRETQKKKIYKEEQQFLFSWMCSDQKEEIYIYIVSVSNTKREFVFFKSISFYSWFFGNQVLLQIKPPHRFSMPNWNKKEKYLTNTKFQITIQRFCRKLPFYRLHFLSSSSSLCSMMNMMMNRRGTRLTQNLSQAARRQLNLPPTVWQGHRFASAKIRCRQNSATSGWWGKGRCQLLFVAPAKSFPNIVRMSAWSGYLKPQYVFARFAWKKMLCCFIQGNYSWWATKWSLASFPFCST